MTQKNYLILGLFALVAGLLSYLTKTLESGGSIKWPIAIVNACSSCFVGLLVAMLTSTYGWSLEFVGALCGFMGWIGVSAAIRIIDRLIGNRLGISDIDLFSKPYKGDERRTDERDN